MKFLPKLKPMNRGVILNFSPLLVSNGILTYAGIFYDFNYTS